jgi:hypothetical protein
MKLPSLKKAQLPKAPPLTKLLGPSFILLGLGLGSGEIILWPFLASKYGLGLIWGALIGITLQFFLNMEIARYTLVTGESIFVGFSRKFGRIAPVWFIFATLVPWMWPGIAAASANMIASLLHIPYSNILPISLLIAIGIILTAGKVVYKTQETFQRGAILIGVPFIFILAIICAKQADWQMLFAGVVGQGEGFRFFPEGLSFATFLGALAYAGAGGTLNLTQSLYVKEKGYGMGSFSGRITSLVSGKKESVQLTGTTFNQTDENVNRFSTWWKNINLEHGIVFWTTGAITMLLLSLLSYSTLYGKPGIPSGVGFVIFEAHAIGEKLLPIAGILFLAISSLMLFFTQFGVLASTSRIMSENFILALYPRIKANTSSLLFTVFLWLQILLGILIILFFSNEPLTLVVTGAVLNAVSMFIYAALLYRVNTSMLPSRVSPYLFRKVALALAIIFYGSFSLVTLLKNLNII